MHKQHKMKSYILGLLLLTITVSLFNSCKEDEFGDWKILNEQWMENHKNDEGFIQTESGLSYKIIHAGDIRFPNVSSYVEVNYTGRLIDGTIFDSGTYQRSLAMAIRGWQEGLRKIRGGGRIILYIPAELAYGEEGMGSIPPHSVLRFDLTLIRSFD